MDSPRPGTGELIAGVGGLALLLVMFLPWFGVDASFTLPGAGEPVTVADRSLNAWEALPGEDLLLAATGVLGLSLLIVPPRLRSTLGLIVIAAAALSALALVLRLIYPPTLSPADTDEIVFEAARRLGAFLGLVATAAIAAGANRAATAAQRVVRTPTPPEPATASAAPVRASSPEAASEPPPSPDAPAPAPLAPAATSLAGWTREAIEAECARSWRVYDRRLSERYAGYFERHQDLRGRQRFSARDLEAALPAGWGELATAVPEDAWDRHHLSGKSTQTLTLGLLGVAARRDPSLGWLADALALPRADTPRIEFEHRVAPELLDERPRQTTPRVLVQQAQAAICIETKWREAGIESCACRGTGVGPLARRCSRAVEERDAYWSAADDLLGLPSREPDDPCPISPSYEAVRIAAAARALSQPDRLGVFALLYDARNPYFASVGNWPGWPKVLEAAIAANADPDRFRFAAISWQELLPRLPLDQQTRDWAAEKHGLG